MKYTHKGLPTSTHGCVEAPPFSWRLTHASSSLETKPMPGNFLDYDGSSSCHSSTNTRSAVESWSAKKIASRRRIVEGAGPQRPAGSVGADDDARGHGLGADEREFARRGSIRKETFACA